MLLTPFKIPNHLDYQTPDTTQCSSADEKHPSLDSKLHGITIISFPLDALLILEQSRHMRSKILDIRLQARLLIILQFPNLSVILVLLARRVPRVNLAQQLRHRRHAQRIKPLQSLQINRHADAPRARMNHKRRFQQMDLLLADLDIEARVGVLEHDILFCFQERFSVESLAGACLSEGVDVGPFAGAGAAGSGVPFLAEGVVEGFVGEELEEALCFFWGGPGVLIREDVGLEVLF